MKQWIFSLCMLVTSVASAQPAAKTLLAIFPHPDDESAIGEVLIQYRNKGYNVQLIIATDGKDGIRVTNIPAGDSLGKLRQEESRCACKVMGIAPPIFLGIERLDTKHGVGKQFAAHKQLLKALKEKIDSIKPIAIITFGPDGDTHHAEHIVCGAAVTELLLREGWVDRYPLYYLAWTKEQGEAFDLGWVKEQYFSMPVAYTEGEEDQALEMMRCYKTQYTEAELAEDKRKKKEEKTNVIHFRRFAVSREKQKEF
jgi:LmbE family N-acetylglucosaminyl deacetylase